MTQHDFDAFSCEFRRLSAALNRYKSSPAETAQKTDAYFHVLKQFPLTLVTAKADGWLAKENKFPTPAQWAGVVIHRGRELEMMTPAEAAEHRYAEQNGYEGEVCACVVCLQAGVSDKPLRYVPTLDRNDDTIQKLDPSGQHTVTAGHWAHGAELARWYKARADFYNVAHEHKLRGDVLKPRARARKSSDLEPMV